MTRRISLFVQGLPSTTGERLLVEGEVGLGPIQLDDAFVIAVHEHDEEQIQLRVEAIEVNGSAAAAAERGSLISLVLVGMGAAVVRSGDVPAGRGSTEP
jgi:hypothetical protein